MQTPDRRFKLRRENFSSIGGKFHNFEEISPIYMQKNPQICGNFRRSVGIYLYRWGNCRKQKICGNFLMTLEKSLREENLMGGNFSFNKWGINEVIIFPLLQREISLSVTWNFHKFSMISKLHAELHICSNMCEYIKLPTVASAEDYICQGFTRLRLG